MTVLSWSPSQRDKCTVHSLQTIMALWKLWGLSCVAPTCLNGWLWKRAHLSHNTVETLLNGFRRSRRMCAHTHPGHHDNLCKVYWAIFFLSATKTALHCVSQGVEDDESSITAHSKVCSLQES